MTELYIAACNLSNFSGFREKRIVVHLQTCPDFSCNKALIFAIISEMEEVVASKFKQLRRSYGFDEVAIVPGDVTINPDQTDLEFKIGDFAFAIPIIAAAMDAVTDVEMVIKMGKLGGLAVLNLDGIQARYQNPAEILEEIARTSPDEVTALMQRIYTEPIKENLVGDRVEAVKKAGVVCAISLIPANTKRLAPIAAEAGSDILMMNSADVPGRQISEVLGLVEGHTVYAIWLGKDLSAIARLVLGGELTEYTEMMGRARVTATNKMIACAAGLGADAIINVRYMTTSVVGSAAELLVYGTAVKLGEQRIGARPAGRSTQ